jgi:hypothetical protein
MTQKRLLHNYLIMLALMIGFFFTLSINGCSSGDSKVTYIEDNQTEEIPYDYHELDYATVSYKKDYNENGGFVELKIFVPNTGNIKTNGWLITHYIDNVAYDAYALKSTYDDDFIYASGYIIVPPNTGDENVTHTLSTTFYMDGYPKRLDGISFVQTNFDPTKDIIIENNITITNEVEIHDDENITIVVPCDLNCTDNNESNSTN